MEQVLSAIAHNVQMIFPELYKLQRTIERQNIAEIAIGTIAIIIGIAILWNQRKIKKQLRQLLEEREKENQEES